MAKVVREINGN